MGYELKLLIGQEYPWADHVQLRRTIMHYAEVDRFYIALKLIDGILDTFVEQVVSDEVRESNPLAGQLVAIPWRH